MDIPEDMPWGTVVGRWLYALADSADEGERPDAQAATGSVTIEPEVAFVRYEGAEPCMYALRKTSYGIDKQGRLVSPDTEEGVRLPSSDAGLVEPSGWVYRATVHIDDVGTYVARFQLHAGAVVDLTQVATDLSSGATWGETTAQRAEVAARESAEAADRAQSLADGFAAAESARAAAESERQANEATRQQALADMTQATGEARSATTATEAATTAAQEATTRADAATDRANAAASGAEAVNFQLATMGYTDGSGSAVTALYQRIG